MWRSFLLLPNGTRIPLHVQDQGVQTAGFLHLDSRIAVSTWQSNYLQRDTVRDLYKTHYNPTGVPRPLFVLGSPYAVGLEMHAPTAHEKAIYHVAAISVMPVHTEDDMIILMSTVQGAAMSVRMWVKQTGDAGYYAVWRVHCTLHTNRLLNMPACTAASALRIQHILHASVVRQPQQITTPSNALERAWAAVEMPLAEPAVSVDADLSWSLPTMVTRLPGDCTMLNALSVGYGIEAGHSLLHTGIGRSLLTANTGPQTAVDADPAAWITRISARIHSPDPIGRSSNAYQRGADAFDQQLVGAFSDYFKDLWTGTTKGIKASLQRLLPSAETIAALKEIKVAKVVSGVKAAATSKTTASLIKSLGSDPKNTIYLQEWGKAVLADAKMDETALGELIINNAPAVEAGMRKMLDKLRYIKPADLKEYGATVRRMIGDTDLRDGVLQLAAAAKNAGRFLAENKETLTSAAKGAASAAGKVATMLVKETPDNSD